MRRSREETLWAEVAGKRRASATKRPRALTLETNEPFLGSPSLLRVLRLGNAARHHAQLALIGAAPSLAASPSPHWSIASESQPTYFKAGDSI